MTIKESKHIKYLRDSSFILDLLKSFCFFTVAIIISHYAVMSATSMAGSSLRDVLLDNIQVFDLYFIDIFISIYLPYLIFILLILKIEYILFSLNSIALLILTRSFFINLTNLGIPEGAIYVKSFISQGGDLFFSGHVAFPYLIALIFWKFRFVRYLFIVLSFLIGVMLFLTHQHYSIDILAAPFIVYGVFEISKKVFKKSYDIIK